DLRVCIVCAGCSGRFGLAPDSTGQNQSSCLADRRAPGLRLMCVSPDPTSVAMGRIRLRDGFLHRSAASFGLATVRRAEDKTRRGATTRQVVGPDVYDPSPSLSRVCTRT